jgi:hypothetical protein
LSGYCWPYILIAASMCSTSLFTSLSLRYSTSSRSSIFYFLEECFSNFT